MSNFKFKRGDIVEIIKSKRGNKGHRFMVGNFDVRNLLSISGLILRSNCNSYETDIKANSNISVFTWTGEDNLKLINPDIDKISEFKFTELMDKITEAITVEQ